MQQTWTGERICWRNDEDGDVQRTTKTEINCKRKGSGAQKL